MNRRCIAEKNHHYKQKLEKYIELAKQLSTILDRETIG